MPAGVLNGTVCIGQHCVLQSGVNPAHRDWTNIGLAEHCPSQIIVFRTDNRLDPWHAQAQSPDKPKSCEFVSVEELCAQTSR
jgi:hypothetical protein